MSHKNQIKQNEFLPVMVSDFLKPWNGWLDDKGSFNDMLELQIPKNKNARTRASKQVAVK
ncbi:MAG: hypothetical protein JST58_14490 [Bacteroidetes bacterium]|jgi:hypothetical protein|nr:hypothetical protein [Bacteroidota bacterium]